MHNNHTPGFYILKEERCKREHENTQKFVSKNTEKANDCICIMFDRINIIENTSDRELAQISYAEMLAYKQLEEKKKTTLLQKIKQYIK